MTCYNMMYRDIRYNMMYRDMSWCDISSFSTSAAEVSGEQFAKNNGKNQEQSWVLKRRTR